MNKNTLSLLPHSFIWIFMVSLIPSEAPAQYMPQDNWYLEKTVNRPDMPGLLAPRGIAVSENDEIFVAEIENNRISVWDENGTLIRAWGSNGANDGQFKKPTGIASFEGKVYVTEWEGHRVQVFDENGNFLRKWGGYGTADGQFKNPWGIAVDRDSNGTQIYVTDGNGHRVQVFDENGTLIRKWGSDGGGDNQLNYPTGIAIGPDGLVYLNSRNNHKVKVFQKNGNYVRSFITTKDNGTNASYPYGLSFTGNRLAICHVYHSDHRVRIYETNGSFVTAIGMETNGNAEGQFDEPYYVATDSTGNLLVSDGKNHRIQVFDANGTYLRKFGFLGDQYFDPTGLLVDEDGNHYVADGKGNRILKWDENATPLSIIATEGSTGGSVKEPRQMAFGPSGRIYAVERDNNRVSVFERNGTFVRSFGSNLDKPEGVTVSPQGEVYVADTNNHRIQVFDLNGSFRRVFGEQGDIDGRFDRPMGLGFNASGELLVADYGNARIQAVDANGSFLWKSNHNASGGLRSLGLSRDGLILLGGRYRLRILDNRGQLIQEIERQSGRTFNIYDQENFTPVAFAPDGSYRYFNGNDELRHYKRAYRTIRPLPSKEMALPEIVSVAQRPGTHYLDISYRIHDLDSPQASARLLAFKDGGGGLDSLIVPKTFVGGAIGKLDDNVSTGQIHTVTWNAGADWNASYGEVEMEVLAKDENNLLNLHFLNLPGTDANASQLKISRSPVTNADLLDVWLWLVASGLSNAEFIGGMIRPPEASAPAGFSPSDISGLKLWLDAMDVDGDGQADQIANGTEVTSWTDKAGGDHNASGGNPPTYSSTGLNWKPALRFDGSTDWLSFSEIDDVRTVFWVLSRDQDGTNKYKFVLGHSNHYHLHPGESKIWHPSSDKAIEGSTYLGGNLIDGTQTDFPMGSFSFSVVTTDNVSANQLGKDRNFDNHSWDGSIAEVLIYNQALSDLNRTKVGRYLSEKWGVGYSGNPYAQGTTTTASGRTYLLNLLNLREASTAEVQRAKEAGTPGGVNLFDPVLQIQPGNRPEKVNEYGFDTGASEGFWVVPTN